MKEYQYEGRTYVESGEFRVPTGDEPFVDGFGNGVSVGPTVKSLDDGKRKILIPKESKMEKAKWKGAEFVLIVKGLSPNGAAAKCKDHILRGERATTENFVTKQMEGLGACTFDTHWSWEEQHALPLPDCTEEIFSAHWGIPSPPKADPLPSALDNFLNTPNGNVCEGARKWAREFATLIYSNPPKAKE